MSELIQKNDNRATIRWKLLTGVSALVLATHLPSAALASGPDHPELWIEFGGQADATSGLSGAFTAPFMSVMPTPDPYKGGAFDQNLSRYALGLDGKVSFQPDGSDWVLSAGIRYGRSHRNRHVHHQTAVSPIYNTFYGYAYTWYRPYDKLADAHVQNKEQHAILDFTAGKDIGLGLFGRSSSSILSMGVRFAQFSSKSSVDIQARPTIGANYPTRFHIYAFGTFYEYKLQGQAERSFHGVGPSLSWNGSAPLAGNSQDGELAIDWGINAAVLFGRQKAKVNHATNEHHFYWTDPTGSFAGLHLRYVTTGTPDSNSTARSHSVMVPNIGGSIGLSIKYPNVKFSIGYRYDTFLNAMDTGIDARKTSNLTFNGPYASISIGIGD